MSFREVFYRLFEHLKIKIMHLECVFYSKKYSPNQYTINDFGFYRGEISAPVLAWCDFSEIEQEGYLQGKSAALGFGWQFSNQESCWLKSPDTNSQWPLTFFEKISFRHENPYGDVRVLWEPARLQQLLVLSLVVLHTEDTNDKRRALQQIEEQLVSFQNKNKPFYGPHYISAMECGLRILVLVHMLNMLREQLSSDSWAAAIAIIHSHAEFIRGRLSLHSSAGNHTVAECAGMLHAGLLLPELKGAKKWVAIARPLLEQEIDRQIVPDGGGIEQSTWYHFLTTDLAMLSASLLRHYNQPSPIIEAAVSRGRRFLQALSNTPEGLPLIGDSDSGYALSKYARLSFADIEKSTALPDFHSFESSGLTYIKQRQNSALYFKHGTFGMAPAYGHGHADALSVLLTSQGQPLLIDTGTFTYTGSQEWRSYFRSTRAHNTVALEGGDQAKQVSAFMWNSTSSANLIASGESNGLRYVCAEIRTTEPQTTFHRRCCIELGLDSWLIWDYVETTALAATLCWHVDIELTKLDTTSLCSIAAAKPFSISVQGGELGIFRGSNDPIAGWKSTRYGVKQAISTIQCSHRGAFPHEFTTIISSGELKPTEAVLHDAQLLIQKLKCKAK